jgi:cell filamentation protein
MNESEESEAVPEADAHYYVTGYTVADDPCVDANGVLVNLLGIRDTASLNIAEADLSSARLIELRERPIQGSFDLAHLCAIHRHIFQDVYPWAGQPRVVDIGKGDSMFLAHHQIAARFQGVTRRLAGTRWLADFRGDLAGYSHEAGIVVAEINLIHAFREGNGRTQREFLASLAAEAGFEINWASVSPQAMITACSEARGDAAACCRKIIRLIQLNSMSVRA